jgi:guanine deaminase
MSDLDYMQMALEWARKGVAAGQSPFGAVIARDGAVLACAHNTVIARHDPSAHAEVNAIRAACRKLGVIDLAGATIYSTTEPCPMCFTAIHWAKISRIVYGATIENARMAGFQELCVSNQQLKDLGGSKVIVEAGLMREECAALFRSYRGPTY